MKKLTALIIVFALFLVPLNIYAEDAVNLIVKTDETFDMESFESLNYGEITRVYKEIFSGFSITAPKAYIEKIKAFKGVLEVYADRVFKIPETEISSSKGNVSFFSEPSGYLGEGAVIAVIDSSFNVAHEIYNLPENTEVKYNKEDISSFLSEKDFNAESGYSLKNLTLTADLVYKSEKIPFAYDYVSNDTDVKSTVFHGNGVASVIAGNYSGGVLPKAQLVLMKVADNSGNVYESAVYSAFQDALLMGVDGINLSMGATAGFSDGGLNGFPIGEIITTLNNSGIIVSVAAGNDGIMNDRGLSRYRNGGGFPFTETTDYGLLASPATAASSIAVAGANSSVSGIASLSSRGSSPDLTLKPDITAKGENYYIAGVDGYTTRGGTSFASPEVCAKTVIIKKELEKRGLQDLNLVNYTKRLMINTADILRQSNDVAISPRAQGGGYINPSRAIAAKAVMYGTDGSSVLSLKDKLEDNFNISFKIENMSEDTLTYTPSLELITDDSKSGRITGSSVEIPHTATFSEEEITLAKDEIKTVTVTVDIDDEWLIKNEQDFTRGFWLEGYIKASEELNIPFMGYYGDWLSTPCFIPYYKSCGFGISTIVNGDIMPAGTNIYQNNTARPPLEKIAISPNGNGEGDFAGIYAALYRNAYLFYWNIQTPSGLVVYENGVRNFNKTIADQVLGISPLTWQGVNSSGEKVPDGRYVFYGAVVADYDGKEKALIAEEIRLPIVVDTVPPKIVECCVRNEDGRKLIDITFSDNHFVQGSTVYNVDEEIIYKSEVDNENKITADITGNTDVIVKAMDYAFNPLSCAVKVADEYIAYYDSRDILLRVEKKETALIDGKPLSQYENISLNENESYFKIMIWDENMKPLY